MRPNNQEITKIANAKINELHQITDDLARYKFLEVIGIPVLRTMTGILELSRHGTKGELIRRLVNYKPTKRKPTPVNRADQIAAIVHTLSQCTSGTERFRILTGETAETLRKVAAALNMRRHGTKKDLANRIANEYRRKTT